MFPEHSILITFRNSHCPSFLPLLWIWWPCFLVGGQCYFWHRQRSTIYYLPSQGIWLNLRPNLKKEVQFHEAESIFAAHFCPPRLRTSDRRSAMHIHCIPTDTLHSTSLEYLWTTQNCSWKHRSWAKFATAGAIHPWYSSPLGVIQELTGVRL